VHRLELPLLPRSNAARGCFPDHWGPHRFERFGDVFFVPAHQALHAKSECRHQYSVACSFLPEAVKAWFDGEFEWTDQRLQASLDVASPGIRDSLFRLGEEVRNPGFASIAMIEMMAGQIVIGLARYYMDMDQARTTGRLSPWKLRLIDERLAQGGAPPSLTELAALCSISMRHLTRAFRISRGRSIGSYIAEHRMDRAKQLLASGACVKSVAYAMGFTSPSNFSTAFRHFAGETPRQYQHRVGCSSAHH
jgi:AraC family transcriptional regulator